MKTGLSLLGQDRLFRYGGRVTLCGGVERAIRFNDLCEVVGFRGSGVCFGNCMGSSGSRTICFTYTNTGSVFNGGCIGLGFAKLSRGTVCGTGSRCEDFAGDNTCLTRRNVSVRCAGPLSDRVFILRGRWVYVYGGKLYLGATPYFFTFVQFLVCRCFFVGVFWTCRRQGSRKGRHGYPCGQ